MSPIGLARHWWRYQILMMPETIALRAWLLRRFASSIQWGGFKSIVVLFVLLSACAKQPDEIVIPSTWEGPTWAMPPRPAPPAVPLTAVPLTAGDDGGTITTTKRSHSPTETTWTAGEQNMIVTRTPEEIDDLDPFRFNGHAMVGREFAIRMFDERGKFCAEAAKFSQDDLLMCKYAFTEGVNWMLQNSKQVEATFDGKGMWTITFDSKEKKQ